MIMRYVSIPLARRIGFRGMFLLLFGSMWTLFGYFQLTEPAPNLKREPNALAHFLPIQYYGIVWIAGGALALIFAFANSFRHPGSDMWGFVGAEVPALLWALNYIVSYFLYGFPRGLLVAIVWIIFSAAIMGISAWPEPPRSR